MEYYGHDFLEELLTLRNEPSCESYSNIISTSANDSYNPNVYSSFPENPFSNIPQNSCSDKLSTLLPFDQHHQNLDISSTILNDFYVPFGDDQAISPPEYTDFSNKLESPPFFRSQDEYSMSIFDDFEAQVAATNSCKREPFQTPEFPSFNMGMNMERKTKVKKLDGQPSKNLMAERRRRKRLNDRLSMLRSVVPKISKMDRTSILGDTIDYMKELLERINNLQQENEIASSDHHLTSIFNDVKPNEVLVRNSPKVCVWILYCLVYLASIVFYINFLNEEQFDVERRDMDTRLDMCCASKPGLLLSTVTTLEALGLEIQHCVISCFSDFGFQASCSEEMDERGNMSSEDIKQALFRNAGYGGRCL